MDTMASGVAIEANPILASSALRSRHLTSHHHTGLSHHAEVASSRNLHSLRGHNLSAADLDERDVESSTFQAQQTEAQQPRGALLPAASNVPSASTDVAQVDDDDIDHDDELQTVRDYYRRHSRMSGDSTMHNVLLFLTTIVVSPTAVAERFQRVREAIKKVSPHARIYAFAEVERSSADVTTGDEAFCGIIQVVPMFTMKQISHSRFITTDQWIFKHVIKGKYFIPIYFLWTFLVGCVYLVLGRVEGSRAMLTFSWCVCGTQVVAGLVWLLHFSRPTVKLLLATYDYWLMMFWLGVSVYCRTQHSQYDDDKTEFLGSDDVSFAFTQLCLINLDAFPEMPRKVKGAAYVINAMLHLYTYIDWWMAVYTGHELSHVVVHVFGRAFPLALVAQAGAAALAVFSTRIAMRLLYRKLDFGVVDFALNIVPHQRFRAEKNADAAKRLNASSSDDDDVYQASPKFNDPSMSLANFHHEQQQPSSEFMRRKSTPRFGKRRSSSEPPSNEFSSNDSITGGGAKSLRNALSTRSSGGSDKPRPAAADVTLHVDGSLPLEEGDNSEAMVATIIEALQPDGVLDSYTTEVSCAFSKDRRTFLPAAFMFSYSPRPLLPFPRVFDVMSRWWYPPAFMSCMVATGVVLSLYLNNHLNPSTYPAQIAVRCAWIVFIALHLAFGVSIALARAALHTLDFWYVLVSFTAQNVASSYFYAFLGATPVAITHAVLMSFLGLYFAFVDCIALPSFTPFVKGVVGVVMALYTIYDLLFQHPTEREEVVYGQTMDLRFTVMTSSALTQLSGLSLLTLYLKIAAKTLWMKSSLVYFQVGAVEEAALV